MSIRLVRRHGWLPLNSKGEVPYAEIIIGVRPKMIISTEPPWYVIPPEADGVGGGKS